MDLVSLRRIVEASSDGQVGALNRLSHMVDQTPGFRSVLVRYLGSMRNRAFDDERSLGAIGPVVTAQLAVQQIVRMRIETAQLPGFVARELWQDVLTMGLFSRVAAGRLGIAEDLAATTAMAVHLGTIELFRGRPYYLSWLRDVRLKRGEERRLAERVVFGRTRGEAFAEVARRTGLPNDVIAGVDAIAEGEPDEGLPDLLDHAEHLATVLAQGDAADRLTGWAANTGMAFGWSDRAVRLVLADVRDGWGRFATSVGVAGIPEPIGLGGESLPVDGREVADHAATLEREVFRLREAVAQGWDVDPITHLPTQRRFLRELADAVHEALRLRRDLWIFAVDLDGFTEINGRFGFEAGDRALEAVGASLASLLPEGCLLARVGPDTFTIAVPTDARGAKVLAQRVRVAIEELRPSHVPAGLRLTASLHAVHLEGMERGQPASGLYLAAMRALASRERRAANHIAWTQ